MKKLVHWLTEVTQRGKKRGGWESSEKEGD